MNAAWISKHFKATDSSLEHIIIPFSNKALYFVFYFFFCYSPRHNKRMLKEQGHVHAQRPLVLFIQQKVTI